MRTVLYYSYRWLEEIGLYFLEKQYSGEKELPSMMNKVLLVDDNSNLLFLSVNTWKRMELNSVGGKCCSSPDKRLTYVNMTSSFRISICRPNPASICFVPCRQDTRRLPFVMMSGNRNPRRGGGHKQGICNMRIKPFHLSDLKRIITDLACIK